MEGVKAIAGSSGGSFGVTSIHPLGLLAVVCLGLLTLWVPRKYALIPTIVLASFISPSQRLVLMSLDFTLLRIMVVFIGLRILMRQEHRGFVWARLDSLFLSVWVLYVLVYTAQWASVSAAITQIGAGFESLGVYFMARISLRRFDDLIHLVKWTAAIALIEALFFLLENNTRHNLFSIFGGVPRVTLIREGRLRCQGPFPHAIIAGVFWAVWIPMFAALWWRGNRDRVLSILGVLSGFVIVYCCASSTPVLSVAAGVVGATFFRMRGNMRYVVWVTIGLLAFLHMVMEAPVWHLIARVSAVGGSTGYHRYKLIDEAISNFFEWALLGVKTTGHWGYGLQDVTNQYILYGIRGGAGTLIVFIWMLCVAYGMVGKSLQIAANDRSASIMVWAVGVSLFVHCMSFIGVSYFGQAQVMWALTVAMVGSLPGMVSKSVSVPSVVHSPEPGIFRMNAGISN